MWNIDAQTIGLVLIALFQAITAIMTYRTHNVATEARDISLQTEKNTNSMKDALVLATGDAAHAAGKEEGRIAGELKAADLAKDNLVRAEQK